MMDRSGGSNSDIKRLHNFAKDTPRSNTIEFSIENDQFPFSVQDRLLVKFFHNKHF